MSAAEPTATSVATAATRFSGSLRHAGSSALHFGITLAPDLASAAAPPSHSFQISSAAADNPPDAPAARGYAPIARRRGNPLAPWYNELDHHKIANRLNAPISMINAATVIAIGRIAL